MSKLGPLIIFKQITHSSPPLVNPLPNALLYDYVGRLVGLFMTQYAIPDGITSVQDLLVREHEWFEQHHLTLPDLERLQLRYPERLVEHRRWVNSLTFLLIQRLKDVGVIWPNRLMYRHREGDQLRYESWVDDPTQLPVKQGLAVRTLEIDETQVRFYL